MEKAKTLNSFWKQLHERGVGLLDSEIDFITSNIITGANEALRFFMSNDTNWPKIIFSDNLDTVGYAVEKEAINIPVPYLQKIAKNSATPIDQLSVTIFSLPDTGPRQIPYRQWLRLAGREETVHHLQKNGLFDLKGRMTSDILALSYDDQLLCEVEVEARKVVDEMSIKLGEKPVWQELDRYLSKSNPSRYNQPVVSFLNK